VQTLDEKMKRIAEDRARLVDAEAEIRDEAMAELAQINEQIEQLEARKEQLESFLGVEDGGQRAAHGQIQQLCLGVLASQSGGLTSSQVREALEAQHPGMKLTSVPATLSRMVSTAKLQRDDAGRYFMA